MSDNIEENEIQIEQRTIGFASIIKLNVKTLITIIVVLYGGLSTLVTVGYFNIKAEIELVKKETEEELNKTEEVVEKEVDNSLHIIRGDIKDLIKEQGDLKSDIRVLIEKTKRINSPIESDEGLPDRDHLPTL